MDEVPVVQFSNETPELGFSNLVRFNVSNSNLGGAKPDVSGRLDSSSFSCNLEFCGKPLPKVCPVPPSPHGESGSKVSSRNQFLIYSLYGVLGFVSGFLLAFMLREKRKPAIKKDEVTKEEVEVDEVNSKDSGNSSEVSDGENEDWLSIENGTGASSLVVLSSPLVEGMTFKELLRAPAEWVGRGNAGSLYKVRLVGGVDVAVKRVKNWEISKEDFKRRMQRIDQVKHPNVLPPLAYCCSEQVRLLVYEFQQNGSLFSLLHESQNDQPFNWGSRVSVAAKIAEALAFTHESLQKDGIAHGNLKSSNIMLNKDMEPCISEYGLKGVKNHQNQSIISQTNNFKSDIYGFGVILLELLAGNEVQNDGFDLASWVRSVVSEELTVEVFDRALVLEGASEERMVNLLHVALKCLSPFPDARPRIDQVATMIRSIKEEEEEDYRSISFDT
ncbi:probable inactive receptor kinase At2g26730 [Rhododendron vialii]|uniref:probable inactive receptor kinase At2g26730 n=1 Tax=Rhododendron vialii TaxID=182163 RepID=UPI00265D901E|nr:probable inactive receptor kinase At2g26730 [Rhododendron vialii]